jgi:hypothetical protein
VTVAPRRIAFAAVLAGLSAFAVIAGFRIQSNRSFFEPRHLLSRFPAEDALALSIDVDSLRRAGLLESKAGTEPDYRQFVDGTGFDYRRDLDSVSASFSQSGSYFIARGRFHWDKLREYTIRQGGSCYGDLCRVAGSRPERHISFLPLRDDAIALAVSTDDLAATRLTKTGPAITAAVPSSPVWISVPGAALRRQNSLPPGMHLMLSALTGADRIVVTFGPVNKSNEAKAIEARMEATCRTADDAKNLVSRLRSVTTVLKEAAARLPEKDKPPAEDEITALLTAGSFDQKDRRVNGKWPVRRTLLDALTAGI